MRAPMLRRMAWAVSGVQKRSSPRASRCSVRSAIKAIAPPEDWSSRCPQEAAPKELLGKKDAIGHKDF